MNTTNVEQVEAALQAGPRTVRQLSAETGLDEVKVRRALQRLVGRRAAAVAPITYSLTPESAQQAPRPPKSSDARARAVEMNRKRQDALLERRAMELLERTPGIGVQRLALAARTPLEAAWH